MPSYPLSMGSICEVSLRSTLQAQRILNFQHYVVQNSLTTENGAEVLVELLLAIKNDPTGWYTQLKLSSANGISFDELRAQIVWFTRRAYESIQLGEEGSVFQDSMPANVAVSISRNGYISGRGKQGRLQVAGVPRTFIAGGKLTAGGLASYAAVGTGLLKSYTTPTDGIIFNPVVWSARKPTEPEPIWKYTVRDTTRTMHRRTVGLGI